MLEEDLTLVCPTCHKMIVDPGFGNSPGDHDPAYHVAQAYHHPILADVVYCGGPNSRWERKDVCWSCGEDWPCPTIQEYS